MEFRLWELRDRHDYTESFKSKGEKNFGILTICSIFLSNARIPRDLIRSRTFEKK